MKKTLAGIGALALLLVTLFSVTSVLMVSAAADTSGWIIGGEGNVTANDDGTLNVAQGSSAVLKQYIDVTDENLDVSVKFTAPFANANQHVMVYLTKDPTVSIGAGAVTPRFSLDGEKYGLSYAWLNGNDFPGYGGGYVPTSNGSVTIRIKNDNGVVRLYMDDTCIYHGDHATNFSNAVKELGGAYLGVAVNSAEGPITATILEVNGKNPTASTTDWLVGGEGNVTANDDGTLNVAQGSSAVLNQCIDVTDENLDVSVKFTAPFANANQHVMVYLTKDPDVSVGAGAITPRFSLDGEKYGLSYAWLNGNDFPGYGGGYVPMSNGSVTIRIKNDNGVIRLYMDDSCIYHGDHATNFSEAVKALGVAHIGVTVQSFEGPITATILEVNGKNPTGVAAVETTTTTEEVVTTTTTKTPVVDETAGDYSADDWVIGGNALSNADGTINVSVSEYATLDRLIDVNAENLDVSIKFTAPFANTDQFVSVYLTKDPTVTSGEGTVVARFALDGEKYGLNYAWLNGADFPGYGGGYVPISNGSVTIRIKNDNGVVRLYMDDSCIYHSDHATNFSNAVKGLEGAYIGMTVSSFNGPITAILLEVNGKNPTGVAAETTTTTEETTTTTEETTTTTVEDATTTTTEEVTTTTTITPAVKEPAKKDDWKSTGVTFNDDGSISLGAGGFASLDRVIDMNDPNLDLRWVVNVENLPHVANADIANFCIYFYSPLSEATPAIDESGASEFYRPRFFIDDMDVFRYSEVIRGNVADMAWGQTDIADYYLWEGSYDVEFRLYNDNGLLRFTANGKQFVPSDEFMKKHSDYLKECGQVYFGIDGINVVLKSFDGMAAYEVEADDTTTTTVDDTTTTTVDDTTTTTVADDTTTTTTTTDGGESPDTGVVGMAGAFAVVALAAVTGGVLTVKKRK